MGNHEAVLAIARIAADLLKSESDYRLNALDDEKIKLAVTKAKVIYAYAVIVGNE